MLYFASASWKFDKDQLCFDIDGSRFAESKFHYKMKYTITELSNNKMILKKKNVELKEEKKT